MPVRNKLKDVSNKQLVKAFASIAKKKATVNDVAESLKVHPSTIRYHLKKGTYAQAGA
jgi:sugar diacid utilization regulator